ncbi:MAG: SDR family oxidoreductase [Candidatus Marinimicrobia bacterium]|jgi:dTDP-4-dehydrorhamnose reductase|nr:SDR family oxidoreductase [Candidatus Neomarinimicrobiota bacterium]
MRIGVTGASGMLGTSIISELSKKYNILATSRTKGFEAKNIKWDLFDLTNISHLKKWLTNSSPDLVIHCAAMVNIEECEKNLEMARKLHIKSTKTIASYLDLYNKKLIYISTDSVFDGNKKSPYIETDKVGPLNVYAQTKLLGEKYALQSIDGLVLRTNIVGFSQSNSSSFADWILNGLRMGSPLNLFDDVLFSPLHVKTLTELINRAIDAELSGLFHCTSRDFISKYQFGIDMANIFNFSNANINKISIDNMNFIANRPKNMALSSTKLDSIIKFRLPLAKDAIRIMKSEHY